jgi:hypothetical protein
MKERGLQMRVKIFPILIALIFLLSACNANPGPSITAAATQVQPAASGYPAPKQTVTENSNGYPVTVEPTSEGQGGNASDHYVMPGEPAFTALGFALAEAKAWKPNAVLMQIPRLRQMEQNLALPQGPNGWFFAFMDPTDGSSVELYVEIIDQKMVGTNEVQQIYPDGKPPYKLLPMDPSSQKLLDSNEVYKIFLENKGNQYIKGKGRVEIDFQLVQIEGMKNPVWSIYDTADLEAAPLINIDAKTGKMVDDPFAFLRK